MSEDYARELALGLEGEIAQWEEWLGIEPIIHPSVYLASGAVVVGAVEMAEGSSLWHNAVIRADYAKVIVGRYTNVQDNCTLHVDFQRPTVLGDFVTIGHNAVVHASVVEDRVLIGMNATILSGAKIGRGSVIGAGALVSEGREIPSHSLAVGVPARVVRVLDESYLQRLETHARRYAALARIYRERQASRGR